MALSLMAAALILGGYLLSGAIGMIVTISLAILFFFLATRILEKETLDRRKELTSRAKRNTYLLIIANEALDSETLRQKLLLHNEDNRKTTLVVPVQGKTLLATISDDIDEEIEKSNSRLKELEPFLRENNININKKIAIEADPLQSAEDEARKLPVSEIVMISREQECWPSEEKAKRIINNIPVSVITEQREEV